MSATMVLFPIVIYVFLKLYLRMRQNTIGTLC